MRKLLTDFGRREAPSAPYVRYLVKNVKETGIFIDKPKREKPKIVRTPETIAAASTSKDRFLRSFSWQFYLLSEFLPEIC